LDVSRAISYSLIIGVLVSASLMAAGSAMLFARGGGDGYALSQLASPSSPVNSGTMGIRGVLAGLASLDGVSLIFLGIMVLIATPIVRVLLVVQFAGERNRLYLALSAIVLVNMLIAILVLPPIVHRRARPILPDPLGARARAGRRAIGVPAGRGRVARTSRRSIFRGFSSFAPRPSAQPLNWRARSDGRCPRRCA
jgi:uncharacterized membrane protein